MNTFTYDEDTRKDIWDKLNNCAAQIPYLKCIIQNPMPLTSENLVQWVNEKNSLVHTLNIIQEKLANKAHINITKVNPTKGE